MVNYTKFPIRSTKHVSSPCDDGYIYIPVRIPERDAGEKEKSDDSLPLL